jgi:hypothetical protein
MADVHLRKGAIVDVSRQGSTLRIVACSGPDDVLIVAAGHQIHLNPGEELVVCGHALTEREMESDDAVGRRLFNSHALGFGLYATTSDVSIVSMLCNLQHLQCLVRPTSEAEKMMCNRLLKTAAAISEVTRNRGSYRSCTRSRAQEQTIWQPVSYDHD